MNANKLDSISFSFNAKNDNGISFLLLNTTKYAVIVVWLNKKLVYIKILVNICWCKNTDLIRYIILFAYFNLTAYFNLFKKNYSDFLRSLYFSTVLYFSTNWYLLVPIGTNFKNCKLFFFPYFLNFFKPI